MMAMQEDVQFAMLVCSKCGAEATQGIHRIDQDNGRDLVKRDEHFICSACEPRQFEVFAHRHGRDELLLET